MARESRGSGVKPKLRLTSRLFDFSADACDLAGVDQMPITFAPNDKDILLIVWRGHLFWMLNRKLLAICKMNIEGPKRRPITHFL